MFTLVLPRAWRLLVDGSATNWCEGCASLVKRLLRERSEGPSRRVPHPAADLRCASIVVDPPRKGVSGVHALEFFFARMVSHFSAQGRLSAEDVAALRKIIEDFDHAG